MNQLLLSRRLGSTGSHAFQRAQYERLLHAVTPDSNIKFDAGRTRKGLDSEQSLRSFRPQEVTSAAAAAAAAVTAQYAAEQNVVAHNGGVNVLAVDPQTGRYLISGGADSTIRLWNLEKRDFDTESFVFHPTASITRSASGSHTHALTSLSIYPFDPVPSTIFTTSYDKTLKLFSIASDRIAPVHTFELYDTPYTHSLSPFATSAALIAVGTNHPAVKLLDLRTGLATHTLPGHNNAIFSVCWSPNSEHILASGSADGRVLFFDVRRAHSAFACLDHDDALGVLTPASASSYQPRAALDWNARAHNGPVTGVRWVDSGRKLVTCGHDQRIRMWDAATGKNELVHFGPRIRNQRNGEFNPLSSPTRCDRAGAGTLFWANDESKGEIFVMDRSEGTMLRILRTPGVARSTEKSTNLGKVTSGGRILSMAWRVNANSDTGLELYSGHGDGSIHCWRGTPPEDQEVEDQTQANEEVERKRKRKRDLLDGLVDGLTKTSVKLT